MLLVKETFVNETKGWISGESGFYPPYTDDVKELFRAMQKEYGRCISKVYIDGPEGEALPIGWVFEKRREYRDSEDTYLQHTWVECRRVADEDEGMSEKLRKYQVVCYTQLDQEDEPQSYADAFREKRSLELLHPENVYRIEEFESD